MSNVAPGAEAEWRCWAGLFLLGKAFVGGHWTSDFLEKARTTLMLINGVFGTFALVS